MRVVCEPGSANPAGTGGGNVKVIVIHPSGAGVLIAAGFKHPKAGHAGSIALTMGLVQASPGCIGS